MNDLTTSLLHSSSLEGTPTPFTSGCASLPCIYLLLNKPFLWVLSHHVSNNKLCTCIYSFCLSEKCIFPGIIPYSLKLLLVWWLGFLSLIQATQVQFLGWELRSHFTPPLTAASLRPVWVLLIKGPYLENRTLGNNLCAKQTYKLKPRSPVPLNLYQNPE